MNRLNSGYISLSQCVYLSTNRFSMAWENGIQIPFPFFVFAWHWKTDLNFAFCFSFSPNFEKRIWTSFFVFRFRITLKNGYEFRFSFSHHFEKQIWISFLYGLLFEKQIWISFVVIARLLKNGLLHQSFEVPGHPLGVDRGIHFLRKEKQLNFLLPGAKVSGELPHPHDISHTRGTPFF